MALTYGFYNSVNHDRQYDAIQFGQIFDGIITDGIYGTYLKGMMVIASENANEVIIQPGRAWFNHTWSFNDANLPFEAPQPEVLLDRVDTLVLDVNSEQAERQNKFLWVQGEPSSQIPQPPNLIRSITHNQYPLCNVYRKAGTTMIYAADITNRVGTSDCPFVTGVLEGIDLDAWINQWDNEFHTWEDSTKNNFETWMLSQQTVYTTWFNSIKDQMDTDMDEFEAWFEEIKDIIDESAALHLQAEIDALSAMLPAGSHITVSTINTELFGRDVTLTDGVHEATARFDQVGFATFESYPYVGLLTITSSDGIQTASTILNVPYFGRYSCEISFWNATVNIDGDPELAGYQVMVRDSSDIVVGAVTLNSEGDGVWSATAPDTYKFSVTYGGGTMEVSLNVTQETTYSITLHGGFNYTDWLSAGGVSGTYASLDDVLADEKAVRQLMTVHASVDYLASFTADDTSVVAILNNDIAAKWITCTAYAEDVLTDAYSALMESIGKYGYGKWVLQGQVPVMTSNTAPSGTVTVTSVYHNEQSNYAGYKAFDADPTTGWTADPSDSVKRISYMFPTAVRIDAIRNPKHPSWTESTNQTFNYEYSDDGSTWNTVITDADMGDELYYTNESTPHKYWACKITQAVSNNGYVFNLQFYTWQPLGNVPIMTSNTAPYGEASASSADSSYPVWKVFDGNDATEWDAASGTTTGYIQYKFNTPICVRRVTFLQTTDLRIKNIAIQGSNDGTVFTDIYSAAAEQVTTPQTHTFLNDDYYLYYRFAITNATGRVSLKALQFYGRQMNVSVPIMTSNTAPYGKCMIVNEYPANTGHAYYAFDGAGSNSHYAQIANTTNSNIGLVGYKFPSKVLPSAVITMGENVTANRAGTLNYSDDGITWIDTGISVRLELSAKSITFITGQTEHQYWGVHFDTGYYVSSQSRYIVGIAVLNFLGFDYSEKEWDSEHPRHYIYDNGVELEEIEQAPIPSSGMTAYAITKDADSMLVDVRGKGANASSGAITANAIDTTPYSYLFARIGKEAGAVYASVSTTKTAIDSRVSFLNNNMNQSAFANLYDTLKAVDVSSANQSVYIAVLAWSGTAATAAVAFTRYEELWLE